MFRVSKICISHQWQAWPCQAQHLNGCDVCDFQMAALQANFCTVPISSSVPSQKKATRNTSHDCYYWSAWGGTGRGGSWEGQGDVIAQQPHLSWHFKSSMNKSKNSLANNPRPIVNAAIISASLLGVSYECILVLTECRLGINSLITTFQLEDKAIC